MTRFTNLLSLASVAASLVAARPPIADASLVRHTGRPVGRDIVHDNVTIYVTGRDSDTAVLYLTDVFGIQLPESRLLADSFGRAGFLTVAPDLFNGEPAPADLDDPSFNVTEFLYLHRPEVTDPIISSAIDYLRTERGVSKVAVTGYCFGGRYSFRLLAEGSGVDVGFAAHPSGTEDAEILNIAGPAAVAFAETDSILPAARRHEYEELLLSTGTPYYLSLYSGTQHGFGVRANASDPEQRFAKEEAFLQAVRWFNAWA